MYLCGCKLSLRAPFCDGNTCLDLKADEESILYINKGELSELCKRLNENKHNSKENSNNKV